MYWNNILILKKSKSMKYLCTSCSYVFDQAMWDKEENIKIWAELEKCPVCEEYYSFQWIDEEVSYIDENNKLDSIEVDHFPEVIIDWNTIEVTVWQDWHPMGTEHRITAICLLDEYWDLIETKYLEWEDEAKIEFSFDDLDEFEIRVRCSVHWIWGKKFRN